MIPENYTEPQVLAILDNITKSITTNATFGIYDIEDLRQEARLWAWEALPRYDPARGSLETFLRTHIRLRLLNLRRDKLIRKQLPCFACKHYLGGPQYQCSEHADKDNCPDWSSWHRRNRAKTTLMSPLPLEDNTRADSSDEPVEQLARQELISIIDANLPMELRRDYRCYLEGGELSAWRTNKVLEAIKNIIAEHYDETDWD